MEQSSSLTNLKLEDIYDVALLSHGFLSHGRDYYFILETNWSPPNGGRYQLLFHHCYEMSYVLEHDPQTLKRSWDDLFTNYEDWLKAGKPEGFLWGANWTLLYPGFGFVEGSEKAARWTHALGKPMQEVWLDMEIIKMTFVVHSWSIKKIGDEQDLISQALIPLQ